MKLPLIPASALAACMLLLAPSITAAQGITGIVSDNRSTANSSLCDADGAVEFGSRTSFQPAVLNDHVASFTHRMAWFCGLLADPPVLASRELHPTLSYAITFTVQDPLNQGYTLGLKSELRGVLRAQTPIIATASAALELLSIFALKAFDPTHIDLPSLTTRQLHVQSVIEPVVELSVNHSGLARVGHWTGTSGFLLFIDSAPSSLTAVGADTYPALSFMQFGLAPRALELGTGFYTGAGFPSLNDLGHYLRVEAVYDIAAVPEPHSAWLLVTGVVLLAAQHHQGGPEASPTCENPA